MIDLILYSIIFIAILLIIVAYKYETPLYSGVASALFIMSGLAVLITDIEGKVGEVWSVNSSTANLSLINVSYQYSNNTGIGSNYWGLILVIIGLFVFIDTMFKMVGADENE